MKRLIPVELLNILVFWFSNCWSCIKWYNSFSPYFKVSFGVRQGSVLSPFLFAVYLNDIVDHRVNGQYSFVILYADDILLITPSLYHLQTLLIECERELIRLDMSINVKKSCCMRIGPRCDTVCSNVVTANGFVLPWVDEIKYLGIVIIKSRTFKCSFVQAKKAFYRSLNAIFGRIGRIASGEVA